MRGRERGMKEEEEEDEEEEKEETTRKRRGECAGARIRHIAKKLGPIGCRPRQCDCLLHHNIE